MSDTLVKQRTFTCYRFNKLESPQLAAAFKQHQAERKQPPVVARVNPNAVKLVTDWLRGAGLAATEVQPNGGTLINEVWIA